MPQDNQGRGLMDLRERLVRVETMLEQLAGVVADREGQLSKLWDAVRTTNASVGSLESLIQRDHAVRQAEAHRDRRTMRLAVGVLSALWIAAQAVQLVLGLGR